MTVAKEAARRNYIPSYEEALNWKKPASGEHWGLNIDALHDNLSKKMKHNAIMEAQSLELAAKFRTNS